MNKWLIIILFLTGMFFDGVIFPALFGFRESFLTIIFLVIMLLYYEVNFQSLIFGVILSGLAEFYWGLRFGILVLPLLASAGSFFLLNKFFNIRSRVIMIISGVIMLLVFWEISILVVKIL